MSDNNPNDHNPDAVWRLKLAARTHDPVEKALVLLRDPAGHTGGTVRRLREALFGRAPLSQAELKAVQKADHWASAADRPQFPLEQNGSRYASWTQVRFDQDPCLIHPLSGQHFRLQQKLDAIDINDIKSLSQRHFEQLIHFMDKAPQQIDYRRTALAFWRFGADLDPALDNQGLGALWQLLPADTRIPDHSIWSHLDLTAAFAGAGNEQGALFTFSIGPVQRFIAQARSTSDLWAGSHLLSRIAWEGIKEICERYGPDSVLFPQLRGIPQVDLWLQQEQGLDEQLFANAEWRNIPDDSNPLFVAAMPNKCVALIPHDEVERVAAAITQRVRSWVLEKGRDALRHLLGRAGLSGQTDLYCWEQLDGQLAGFPEVHWAAVPWSLVADPQHLEALRGAMAPFYAANEPLPFIDEASWRILSREISVTGATFYRPNGGILYGRLYELLERLGAAAKSARPFEQRSEKGYRDSLSGEAEWLTESVDALAWTPRQREENGTLWTKVAGSFGIRSGEHLSALGLLKRLWPTLFVAEIDAVINSQRNLRRYVISTHTMALATTLERWIARRLEAVAANQSDPPLDGHSSQLEASEHRVALPRRLVRQLRNADPWTQTVCRHLPGYLDVLKENEKEGLDKERTFDAARRWATQLLGDKPEAYYALLLLDGDRVGAWLSGGNEEESANFRLPYQATFHPQLRESLQSRFRNPQLTEYLTAAREVSPGRHMAISEALNGFSLHLVPYIVEERYKGKLFYAGGDDVMAMVSLDELLEVMLHLRLAYSGLPPNCCQMSYGLDEDQEERRLELGQGFALLHGRGAKGASRSKKLFRLMGQRATASVGAVVVHHTTPLATALRELRSAEKQAKALGGAARDSWFINILKRAGGAVSCAGRWQLDDFDHSTLKQLQALRGQLAGDAELSRRMGYMAQSWLRQLPPPAHFGEAAYQAMLAENLAHQFRTSQLGQALAHLAAKQPHPAEWLCNFLAVADFFAREGRSAPKEKSPSSQRAAS